MKGISIWLFSKVVMLIFLLTVFGTVIGFLGIVNEKVAADSAESLASQVKDSVKTVVGSGLLSASIFVPLPKALPEKSELSTVQETRTRQYSLTIQQTNDIVTAAVSWQIPPINYAAAASFISSSPVHLVPITANSRDHGFLFISKSSNGKVTICGCEEMKDCSNAPVIPPEVCRESA